MLFAWQLTQTNFLLALDDISCICLFHLRSLVAPRYLTACWFDRLIQEAYTVKLLDVDSSKYAGLHTCFGLNSSSNHGTSPQFCQDQIVKSCCRQGFNWCRQRTFHNGVVGCRRWWVVYIAKKEKRCKDWFCKNKHRKWFRCNPQHTDSLVSPRKIIPKPTKKNPSNTEVSQVSVHDLLYQKPFRNQDWLCQLGIASPETCVYYARHLTAVKSWTCPSVNHIEAGKVDLSWVYCRCNVRIFVSCDQYNISSCGKLDFSAVKCDLFYARETWDTILTKNDVSLVNCDSIVQC